MTTKAEWIHLDAECAVHTLQHEVVERVNLAEGEVILDFSSLPRIDPVMLSALEGLADLADGRKVKLRMHGVNGDIYKVLKLLRLARRFSFDN